MDGWMDGWTREYVWAKSHGNFGTDLGAGTDVHHLRPEDNSVKILLRQILKSNLLKEVHKLRFINSPAHRKNREFHRNNFRVGFNLLIFDYQ